MHPKLPKKRLGKLGEDLATAHLRASSYTIIDRNFRKRYAELDIIATKDNILVFVEVKTRMGDAYGTPEEAVTSKKLKEIMQLARYYIHVHDTLPDQLRIDVVAIELHKDYTVKRLNHIENVTQ